MKKIGLIICIILSLTVLFCFSACNVVITPKDDAQTQPPIDQSPEPEPEKMSFEQFLEKAEGIWISTDSIAPFGEDDYTYEFCSFSKEYYGGGVYPGGGSRPAKIDGFEQLDENVFRIDLYYEAGNFMGEDLPEGRDHVTFTFVGDKVANIRYSDGPEVHSIYGGEDIPFANAEIESYLAKNLQ